MHDIAGEPEQIHIQNTEQLHAHDCHRDATETSGHRLWHKKYKHMHNTGTKSQAMAQWSSPAGMSHTVYIWMCCTLAAYHVLCKTRGLVPRWHGQMKHLLPYSKSKSKFVCVALSG